MKISHQSPDANLDWKVQAPLVVETPSGEFVRIESWSLAGLTWPEGGPDCPQTCTLSIPFQGVDIRFPVRLSQKNATGTVQLEGLSGRQRETLALFYRALLSGRMASSGEVITSLDTPVDLVPMEETEAEQSQQPVKYIPRPLRALFNIVTYLLILTMVVGIIGNNIFSSLDRIDIQHGRVLAPMNQTFPARGGFVESVEVSPGQAVQAGDVLIRLREPETHASLVQTKAELGVAEAEYARVMAGLDEIATLAASDNLAMRMAVASRLYSGFVGKGRFDDIRQNWISLRQRNSDLAEAFDPLSIVREMLTAEAESRAAKVESLKADRNANLERIAHNHVRAPSDGVVHEVMVQPGQPFGGQEMDLSFESSEPRVTIGWVSEKFAETIYIGMPALIGLNENGEKIKMQGVVTDVRAGGHPERPGEFGIMVTVSAIELSPADSKIRLRVGAPVNLEAKRQLGLRLRNWFAERVGQYD